MHDYLDEREIDGYSVHYTPFYPTTRSSAAASVAAHEKEKDGAESPITCMVYIGQPTNPQFLRDPARRDPRDVARVISVGHGLSGKGTEYLYLLEEALEGLGLASADVHVTDLVRRVKAIEAEGQGEKEEEEAKESIRRSLEGAEPVMGRETIE